MCKNLIIYNEVGILTLYDHVNIATANYIMVKITRLMIAQRQGNELRVLGWWVRCPLLLA